MHYPLYGKVAVSFGLFGLWTLRSGYVKSSDITSSTFSSSHLHCNAVTNNEIVCGRLLYSRIIAALIMWSVKSLCASCHGWVVEVSLSFSFHSSLDFRLNNFGDFHAASACLGRTMFRKNACFNKLIRSLQQQWHPIKSKTLTYLPSHQPV